jgi:hypothetical protein
MTDTFDVVGTRDIPAPIDARRTVKWSRRLQAHFSVQSDAALDVIGVHAVIRKADNDDCPDTISAERRQHGILVYLDGDDGGM